MSIAEKILSSKADLDAVYEAGKKKGAEESPLYYAGVLETLFSGVTFPENTNIVLKVRKAPSRCASMFYNAINIKSIKLISEDNSNIVAINQAFRNIPSLETIDLTKFNRKFSDVRYFALGSSKLKSVYGALDLSNCSKYDLWLSGATALEDIEIAPQTIKYSIDFSPCTKLSHDSLMSIFDGLYDYGIKVVEYDVSAPYLSCMSGDKLTNGVDTYTITNVQDYGDGEYEIWTKSSNGKEVGFFCHSSMGYSQEIINAFKVDNAFVIDANVIYDGDMYIDYTYNSFKVVSTEGSTTTQTATLGTTNLNKLTDEEKAIATEKGWTLA